MPEVSDSPGAGAPSPAELRELQLFVVQLGAAMNAAGETVYEVQERLARVAHAYDPPAVRISAFPTFLMVTMGSGEPATLELTSVAAVPRLDQIASLDRLVRDAEHGAVRPDEGLRRLDGIAGMRPRFGRLQSIAGYAVLTLGLCLILKPSPRDVAAAALLGALVGLLRSVAGTQPPVQALMPLVTAFVVSALSALAVEHDLTEPGLRALLAFGIVAGIQAVGASAQRLFSGSPELLGAWARWLGVLIFATGVVVANSAPPRSFPGMLLVLYAAWAGQVAGNAIFGG